MPLVSFSHPSYLWLLPFLVAGAVLVARRSLADLSAQRARVAVALRIALLLCLVLALAGARVALPTRRLSVLFVLDLSDSIPPEQRSQAIRFVNEAARRMGPNDEAGILVFGSEAYVEAESRRGLALRQIHSVPSRDHTDIAAALRLALAAFPEGAQRRVVLLSDGNENLGDALQEAASAAAAGVQVDVVPIVYHYRREVLLDKLIAPGEAKVGEPFEVRVIARSTIPTAAEVRLFRNGELVAQQAVHLQPGPNAVIFRQALETARFHTYEAVIEGQDDEVPDNNRALGFVMVRGRPRVLIVENDPSDARFLATALRGQQLQVDVRRPGQLPATLAEFQTYDSIVLSNVGAYQLTPEQMKAIRSSVRDLGAGLVMIGGENSFGPGAYRGTPIEEALPVEMDVKKHQMLPVGAVALVLHSSEFPDGNRWARETAATVVDALGDRDRVGVLLFDTGERWGIPMQPAANRDRIKAELYNLSPGDMPDFNAILEMAYDGLTRQAPDAAVRHIIILSDADPQPASPALLRKIVAARITISGVAIGMHGPNNLLPMVRATNGRFYEVKQPDDIPSIFLKETQQVLKPAIYEETFVPNVDRRSELSKGIGTVPPLMGYVAASPKEAPSVEVAMSSRRNDPILASWRYGLGKAVAFTSDAKNRWAAPWVASPSFFSRFWAQTIRWTVRSTARGHLDSEVEIRQRKGHVTLDVTDSQGRFVNGLDIRGSVAGERVSPTLRIDQTAPGRYEGEFDAPDPGQYLISLRYTDPGGTPRFHTIGAAVPYSPEYRDLAANSALLTGLAERTGGRVHPELGPHLHEDSLRRIWRHDRRAHRSPQDLWPALALLAALLLPLDIAVRRLMIARSDWLAIREAVLGRIVSRFRRRAPRAEPEPTGRLLTAKQRAAQRMGAPAEAPPDAPNVEPAPARPATPPAPPAGRQAPAPTPSPPAAAAEAPASPPPATPAEQEETTSRLLRAKRRAREKTEE